MLAPIGVQLVGMDQDNYQWLLRTTKKSSCGWERMETMIVLVWQHRRCRSVVFRVVRSFAPFLILDVPRSIVFLRFPVQNIFQCHQENPPSLQPTFSNRTFCSSNSVTLISNCWTNLLKCKFYIETEGLISSFDSIDKTYVSFQSFIQSNMSQLVQFHFF